MVWKSGKKSIFGKSHILWKPCIFIFNFQYLRKKYETRFTVNGSNYYSNSFYFDKIWKKGQGSGSRMMFTGFFLIFFFVEMKMSFQELLLFLMKMKGGGGNFHILFLIHIVQLEKKTEFISGTLRHQET